MTEDRNAAENKLDVAVASLFACHKTAQLALSNDLQGARSILFNLILKIDKN